MLPAVGAVTGSAGLSLGLGPTVAGPALEPTLSVLHGIPTDAPVAGAPLLLEDAAVVHPIVARVVAALERMVTSATGWPGLGIIWLYSFLIAFVLPGPSEVVLAAPLDLGLPYPVHLGLIMLVSGFGKACGSVFAFHIGQEAKQAGPVERVIRRSRWDVLEWSERQAVQLARRWGYVGLAIALSVPFFPDTISIYAFAVLEEDYRKFAVATFAGSIGRLLVTVALIGGALAVW